MLTNKQIRKRLFDSLFHSFLKKEVILSFILIFVLMLSSLYLIVIRYEYKLKLTQEKNLIIQKSKYEEQYSQIVLEYSTLASPTAVENFADKEKMILPTANDIKIITLGDNQNVKKIQS